MSALLLAAMLSLYAQGYYVPPVRYEPSTDNVQWAAAVACHSDFADRAGNAQHYCPEGFVGALIRVERATYEWLRYALVHEGRHLLNTSPGPSGDLFREQEAHAAGCAAEWIEGMC